MLQRGRRTAPAIPARKGSASDARILGACVLETTIRLCREMHAPDHVVRNVEMLRWPHAIVLDGPAFDGLCDSSEGCIYRRRTSCYWHGQTLCRTVLGPKPGSSSICL